MKLHTIYFEFLDKKMKIEILAKNREDAINKLRNKINIHKVTSKDDVVNQLKSIFGMK